MPYEESGIPPVGPRLKTMCRCAVALFIVVSLNAMQGCAPSASKVPSAAPGPSVTSASASPVVPGPSARPASDAPPAGLAPPPASGPPEAPLTTPPAPRLQHADPELEALLPDTIQGVQLVKESHAPDAFLNATNDEAFNELLIQLGRSREHLSLARASDARSEMLGVITAVRVSGADSDAIQPTFLANFYANSSTSPAFLGGKEVTVVSVGGQMPEYHYVYEDVIFVVASANEDTAAQFLEALP